MGSEWGWVGLEFQAIVVGTVVLEVQIPPCHGVWLVVWKMVGVGVVSWAVASRGCGEVVVVVCAAGQRNWLSVL